MPHDYKVQNQNEINISQVAKTKMADLKDETSHSFKSISQLSY